MDYQRLLDLFPERCRLIRAFYYTARHEDQEEFEPDPQVGRLARL